MKNIFRFILIALMMTPNSWAQKKESKKVELTGYYLLEDRGEELRGVAGSFRYCSRKGTGVLQIIQDTERNFIIFDELLGDAQFQERAEYATNYKQMTLQFVESFSRDFEKDFKIDRNFDFLPRTIFNYEGPSYLYKNTMSQTSMERLRDKVKVEVNENEVDSIYVIRRDTRYRDYYREGVFTKCRYKKIPQNEFQKYLEDHQHQFDGLGYIQGRSI